MAMSSPSFRSSSVVLAVLFLITSACSVSRDETADPSEEVDSGQATADETAETTNPPAEEVTAADEESTAGEPLTTDGSIRPGPFQLTIDALPEQLSNVRDAVAEVIGQGGEVLGKETFADNGMVVIRQLPAGPATLRFTGGGQSYEGPAVDIPGETAPDQSIYQGATLNAGYGYIATRDGTTLSAFVSLPGSASDGPYPTLIEYSGYSPSDPTASADPYRLLIPSLGYALVQVNVRGTGCSGGSFDAFERVQSLDGYDVVETVAAQPWSDKIGMFGVSYPGIMQLHVASTKPPSLAAIAPLSPLGRVDSVLYPGGIFNNGFGQEWSDQVGSRALANGQPWAADRVTRGDQTCAANQELRGFNPDLVDVVRQTPFINDLARERSAETHADAIQVPTFIGGAWQDEQTGGRFVTLLDELQNAPVLRAVLYNGLHIDSISAEMLVKLIEFFDLYVGDRPPGIPPVVRVLIGVGLSGFFGSDLTLPPDNYPGLTAAEARAQFEAEPPIEILFEQGATAPNLPVPSFRAGFASWPPETTQPLTWYLGGDQNAVLSPDQPEVDSIASFVTNPAEGQVTTAPDVDTIWTADPGWVWPTAEPGTSVVTSTAPLETDLVMAGNLSADLWVSVADGTDADLEVTLSEVAPDGSETYVQSGWLRLSRRALSDEATELRPVISGAEEQVAPVVSGGDPVEARIEVLPFAHVFRTGSQVKITIDTPGGSKPQWRFEVAETPVTVNIHSGPETPSKVVLPVLGGIDAPEDRPACGSLRGQPCRQG